MRAQMTSTAWSQGLKNASICGIGALVSWCVIAAAVWQFSGQPLLDSIGVAATALWGFAFLAFLGTWLYGRAAAGRVLLDCGAHPMWWLFLINAILFLIIGVLCGPSLKLASAPFGIAGPVLGVTFAAYWFIMATGRVQALENGIWVYWGLLRWGSIGSYCWTDDSTLVVRSKRVGWLMQGALPIPPRHRQRLDALLGRHFSNQAVAEPENWT